MFVNIQNYFQLLIHVQISLEFVDIIVIILGLIGYKSPMTPTRAKTVGLTANARLAKATQS